MTAVPLADKCWALIFRQRQYGMRGLFFFMSGETAALMQRQRDLRVSAEQIYGVRIMIDDSLRAGQIELRHFMQRADLT